MESSKELTFSEFLGSEIVELCSSTRSETLKIHRKVLESKCSTSAAALKHNFQERHSMRMTFQETRYETVAQFVEWAYRGDYTEVASLPIELREAKQPEALRESSSLELENKTPLDDSSKTDITPEKPPRSPSAGSHAHTLLCHLHVYIFGDIYIISGLKDLAFEKFKSTLKLMGKPKSMSEQLAIVDCLELTFSKVPLYDMLSGWFAQHASWCLEELRLQSKFHDLLQALPRIGSRMMNSLKPAQHPSWDVPPRSYAVLPYDARAAFEDPDYY